MSALGKRFVAVLTVSSALLVGCGGDGESATTTTSGRRSSTTTEEATTTSTVPPRPTSTTTTMYDPASVEGQVEAAYLKSWDVYADAVYNLELDESALSEVYADEGLENIRREISTRIAERRAALVNVDLNYQIAVTGPDSANILDQLRTHQVRIDPETKQPVEPPPDEAQVFNFVMKLIDGRWRVALVQVLT